MKWEPLGVDGASMMRRWPARLSFSSVFSLLFCYICAHSAAAAANGTSIDDVANPYASLGAPTDTSHNQLGDGTLSYRADSLEEDYVPLGHSTPHALQGNAPHLQDQQPVHVERHVIVLGEERARVPVLRGRGFFILGLLMLAMCLSAINSHPDSKSAGFLKGVASSARNVVEFKDLMRSLFVLITALSAPLLIFWGARRLVKTLPAYLKWAKDNDEFGIAQFVIVLLYVWMFFFDPTGK
ncbi:hypothetical protein, conserved [Eimeria acervulina]|uniref:Transmembrane protein n=1 Tax=Eimeria acervulina TaxID=5801 RepID=U6GF30_EIMAC|nr:hypothetical protein, conserved [Eimeria acervulina]CDI78861.1 hypothetical protein, conserved [Eimeria acervulina]